MSATEQKALTIPIGGKGHGSVSVSIYVDLSLHIGWERIIETSHSRAEAG